MIVTENIYYSLENGWYVNVVTATIVLSVFAGNTNATLMNSGKRMSKKIKFTILGVVILIATSVYFQLYSPEKEIRPPPATLSIDGKEQISGIGSYCWEDVWKGEIWKSVCADYAGIPTVSEPLPANSTFTAHLSLPLMEPPQELQLRIIQVTNKDILEKGVGDLRFWRSDSGKSFTLPLESEQDVNLSLEPGLYVFKVFPRWKEKGSVSYGFLLQVQ